METYLKLFVNYFAGLVQLMNIFQCDWNNFRILSHAEINWMQFQTWLHVKLNTEIISELCQNNVISHVTRAA